MADEKAAETVLGSLIRYKRQATGLSQERLEVSRQAVAKWESGKGFPSAERLLHLGQALDIPVEALLGRAAVRWLFCPQAAGSGNGCALDRVWNPVVCQRRADD